MKKRHLYVFTIFSLIIIMHQNMGIGQVPHPSKVQTIQERLRHESLVPDELKREIMIELRNQEARINRLIYSNRVMESEVRNRALSQPVQPDQHTNKWLYFLCLNAIGLTFFLGIYYWKIKKMKNGSTIKKRQANTLSPKNINTKLTNRERDVLALICESKSNPEIAEHLYISINTTKTHVANILNKLNVNSREDAIFKAQHLNLLKTDGGPAPTSNVRAALSWFIIMLSYSPQAIGQTILNNQTNCNYLIKINITPEGQCRFDGTGPLVQLKANDSIVLPKLPPNTWIPGYGIEEISTKPAHPEILGFPTCNYKIEIRDYGTCKATIKSLKHGLIIST